MADEARWLEATGCIPPAGTAPDTYHWLRRSEQERVCLEWCVSRQWRVYGVSAMSPEQLHRAGWKYEASA